MESASAAPPFGFSFTQGAGGVQLRRGDNTQNSPGSTAPASKHDLPGLHGGGTSPSATGSFKSSLAVKASPGRLYRHPCFVTSSPRGPREQVPVLPSPGGAAQFPADLFKMLA